MATLTISYEDNEKLGGFVPTYGDILTSILRGGRGGNVTNGSLHFVIINVPGANGSSFVGEVTNGGGTIIRSETNMAHDGR